MAENLNEKLNRAIDVVLVARKPALVASADAELAPLVQVAAELRGLPRESFKEHLRAELERRSSVSTAAQPSAKVHTTASSRLAFKDVGKAIEFYQRAFEAREIFRFKVGGNVAHAEIAIGDSAFHLSEEWPEGGRFSAETLGNSPVWLSIGVGDVDAFAGNAIAAGMKVKRAIQDQFYGKRDILLTDPFGYTWNVNTVKEEMPVEEMQRRYEETLKQSSESEEGKMASGPAIGKSGEETKAVPYIREGFHTITPYILVNGAARFIDFLKEAFGAEERGRVPIPSGKIMHAEVKVGDSMIEMSDGNEQYGPSPVALHYYVDDADAAYARAIKAGAISTHAPIDQPYGDREAGIKDPFGNAWFIATPKTYTPFPGQMNAIQVYLFLRDAEKMAGFLESAFGAKAEGVHKAPDGTVAHATIRIGDNTLEFSEAHEEWQPSVCHLHLYVPDTDAVYAQALHAGATTIEAPSDKPYGDRSAGVRDPWGNSWFIATHMKDVAF